MTPQQALDAHRAIAPPKEWCWAMTRMGYRADCSPWQLECCRLKDAWWEWSVDKNGSTIACAYALDPIQAQYRAESAVADCYLIELAALEREAMKE